ncbi:MAG: hypothetical protein H6698_08560, partial [Myxococcales bacterium]|nr:hypothetical protein [Myxococcales bacterium]
MVTTRDADSSRRGWSRRVALPLAGVVALSLVLGGFERAAAQEAGSGAPAPAPVEAAAVAPVSEPARARADEPRATRAAIAAAALTAAGVIDTAAGLVPAPLPGTPSTPGALAAAAGISEDSLDSASALTTARQTISAHVDALAATVDAATASRDFFVARGNETRARLASSEGLRLPLLIQLGAARVVAAEQVVALRRGARELAGARSTLTALDARLAALQNAPAEPEGAAAAERDRLAAEQARTSEVAERASEAQDRARAERTQAVGATAEAIASRWEALAPRLQAVVDGRVASEQVLEALNARRSEFAEQQVRYTTALRDVKTTEGRRQREALADPLLDDLIAQRREVRAAASNRRAELRTLERALEEAASAAEAQRAASAEIPDGLDADTSDSLRELAAEELRVVVEEQQLAALRLANADTRWRLSEAQINFYARTIDELLPYLSEARADSLFRINGENIREARTNLAERVRGLTVRVKAVVSGEPLLADGRAGWSVSSILTPLITVLLLLVLVRTGPAYRDPVVVWIVSLRQRGPFRRTGPAFLKLGEVLHETAQQTLVVVALVVARRVLPDLPELALLLSWLFWIAAYAWVTRALGVLLIPMTERPAVLVGTPPDELRLGVDLWELTLPTARLLVRTSRLVLLYMVVGRVGLAAARFLFGPGFVFHWAQWTFNAALAAILYFVAWLWRAEIVSRFAAQAPAAAAGLVDWAGKHRDRPYSVLLVALIGVWLLTRGLARVVATWLSGKTVGQMVT